MGQIRENFYYKKLIKKIKEYGLEDKIKFTGQIDENALRDYYINCAFGIYTPIREDFGMVPLEFNSAGKICLSINEGGCVETTPEEYRFSNFNELGEQILKLINMPLKERKKIGGELRKRSASFSDKHFNRMLGKVEELIG